MIRTLTTAAAATALLAVALPAVAQEPAASPWSFTFGAATDNRSKDVSKSDGDPFVWGEAQWESASGLFYAGPSFETIKSSGEYCARRRPLAGPSDRFLSAVNSQASSSAP